MNYVTIFQICRLQKSLACFGEVLWLNFLVTIYEQFQGCNMFHKTVTGEFSEVLDYFGLSNFPLTINVIYDLH